MKNFWCWLLGHEWEFQNRTLLVGAGEPLPGGGEAIGVPTEAERWKCSGCGEEKYMRVR